MSKSKNVRRGRDFGGRSVEDVHAKYAFPAHARCEGCGSRPFYRAIVLAPLDEALKRMPDLQTTIAIAPQEVMSAIVQIRENPTDTVGKQYLRISRAYSCKGCRRTMEKALAKAPSWCIVEINEPPRDTIQAGYGS